MPRGLMQLVRQTLVPPAGADRASIEARIDAARVQLDRLRVRTLESLQVLLERVLLLPERV